MQVLIVTAILAGIATFILRASLSRTSNARRTRRLISAQLLIDSCMAEVNTLWAAKDPDVFTRDMNACIMYCATATSDPTADCGNKKFEHICEIPNGEGGNTYKVVATIAKDTTVTPSRCKVTYAVKDEAGHSVL